MSDSCESIIERIKRRECFEAFSSDGSLFIRIQDYFPWIGTAIHNGHQLIPGMEPLCALKHADRWFEEDPGTGFFIESLPITIIANDSRYAYDLNRSPDEAVYDEAWGRKVWKKYLTDELRVEALKRHELFYRVIDCLVEAIEDMFGSCLIYDMHSYNYGRIEGSPPLFNLGCRNIYNNNTAPVLNQACHLLENISIPHMECRTAMNEVFHGNGYLQKHISSRFPESLVLSIEIKKVYCRARQGKLHLGISQRIRKGLEHFYAKCGQYFYKNYLRKNESLIRVS